MIDSHSRMKPRVGLIGKLLMFSLAICCYGHAAKKPKLVVLVSAVDKEASSAVMVTAFLVLPDGTHAKGTCLSVGERECDPESFTPEKRAVDVCKGV
jgi:hypothetical protein